MAYYNNPYLGYYPQMMPMMYPQQMVEQPQQSSQPQQTNNSLMV